MNARKSKAPVPNDWVHVLVLRKGLKPHQRNKLLRQWRFAMRDAVIG